jgi:capsular polysaccharide biosynthesis protein
MDKTDAVRHLAVAHGFHDVDPWGDSVGEILDRILRIRGRSNRFGLRLVASDAVHARRFPIFNASSRVLRSPIHLSERPQSFPPAGIENAFSPGFTVLSVPKGIFWNFVESPLVLAADGISIVRDYSSKYAPLVHFHETDPADAFRNRIQVDGTAIVMTDDVRPLNFCHWLIDGLPRFAALGERARNRDVYAITLPLTAPFQLETLRMCGFERDRIIEVTNFQAVQARELMVTSDLNSIPHPAFKAAPWAMSYLRSTIGLPALASTRSDPSAPPRKIFVSRNDAAGRRIRNEDSLHAFLREAGYTRIVLSDSSLGEQIRLFAGATHVVGAHGAGLSHVAFLTGPAVVIELFPATYGMPSYYVLTAGLGNTYASYVTRDVAAGPYPQRDDLVIDVADFERRCGHLL